jgi:hypothetical protein
MATIVSEEGFHDEFVGELPGHLAERVSPICGSFTGR